MPRTVPLLAVTVLACLAGVLTASPLSLQDKGIDSSLFANLRFFEQYAAAAYCPGNNDVFADGPKLTCNSGNCPLVEANDVTTVYEFENSLFTDVTGYVAVDHTHHLTIVAFRGARSVRSWITGLKFVTSPTDICSGCTAHEDFWNSWRESRQGVLATLTKSAQQFPSYKVVVVGHSLGGAIATFAAAEIRNLGIEADLYTYGAPRIAGKTLSDFITNQNRGGNFRVTHTNDPVPRLPSLYLDFVHISPEYWITSPDTVVPTVNDVKRLDGDINMEGNTGQKASNTDAHLWYFGPVAECSPTGRMELKKREADAVADLKRATACQPAPSNTSAAAAEKRGCAVANSF